MPKLTLGYLEFLGQPSIATIILCPSNVSACLVSIRIRGILRSAGVNKWRLAYEQPEKQTINFQIKKRNQPCTWSKWIVSSPL